MPGPPSCPAEFRSPSRRRRAAFFCVALTLAIPHAADAGAWAQKTGEYYFKLSALTATYREEFDEAGTRVPRSGGMGELSDFSLGAYLEYGIDDDWTLVASAPYKRLTDERTLAAGIARESNRRLGDLELRLRRPLRLQPLVISVALGGKIPLGYPARLDTRVPVGTGKIDTDLRLLVGRSFHPVPAYATGELGFRLRGGDFGNETFFSIETGASSGRLLLKARLDGVRTLGECGASGQGGLIGDQDILKLSPGVIYGLPGDAELSFELIRTAAGCNTTSGNTWILGIARKR